MSFLIFSVLLLFLGCASKKKTYKTNVYNQSEVWSDLDQLTSRDFANYQDQLREPLLKIWKQRQDAGKISQGALGNPKSIVEAMLPKDGRANRACKNVHRVILLIHGLYDSPYTMKDLGRVFNEQCFDTRFLLLPGHGSQTGDLRYTKMEDWLHSVNFAVNTLKQESPKKDIYIAGFSTGGALAIDRALEDSSIKGVFLFAPLLARKPFSRVVSFLTEACCEFIEKQEEVDSIKYESTTANSVIQAGRLVERLQNRFDQGEALTIPVFVTLAKNDYTVPSIKTLQFLREGQFGKKSYAVVYTLSSIDNKETISCQEATKKNSEFSWKKTLLCKSRFTYRKNTYINDFSHMALTLKPDDPHYGFGGDYKYCLHYKCNDRQECQNPSTKRLCYGEREMRGGQHSEQCKKGETVIQRLTFNPLFDHLQKQLETFIHKLDSKSIE